MKTNDGNATTTNGNGSPAPADNPGPTPEGTKMRRIQGWGYRYGREHFVSFDPVIGGWPVELEVSVDVTLQEITSHQPLLKGERTSTRKLIEAGLLRGIDLETAEERFKASKKEDAAKKAAERAQEQAKKAAERAAEAAKKAEEIAKKARERAALVAETAKTATPPKQMGTGNRKSA